MRDVEGNYRALLAVTNALNSQRDTDGLWHVITEQIKKVVPWDRAGVTLYNAESDSFRFYVVETSMPTRVLQRDAVIPRVGSAVGWVYEHRRIHVRPDLKRERVFLEDEFFAQEGLGRMINLPLLIDDTCLGTLNIGSVQTGDPDVEDMEFLAQVASQIAFAIDHVQAYETDSPILVRTDTLQFLDPRDVVADYQFPDFSKSYSGRVQSLKPEQVQRLGGMMVWDLNKTQAVPLHRDHRTGDCSSR